MYQTSDLSYDVPDLLAGENSDLSYTFSVQALNGDSAGASTEVSNPVIPTKNRPAQPLVPKVLVANPEEVTFEIVVPSMNGAAVYDCDMLFAVVETCGVETAEFTTVKPFVIGPFNEDKDYLSNLGHMYKNGQSAQQSTSRANLWYTQASLFGFVDDGTSPTPVTPTPPVHRSKHVVKIDRLKDGTTYSVKMKCYNEIGAGPLSSYSPVFATPKIITMRNISATLFRIPLQYISLLLEKEKTTASFFSRYPIVVGGVTYTKRLFCGTHLNQCKHHPFSYVKEGFNNTNGEFLKSGWYFGQGDDRYCKAEFPKATCRSLSKAIQATMFDGVTFYLGKGIYKHADYSNSVEVAPLHSGTVDESDYDDIEGIVDANSTNTTETPTLPILHHYEQFPIVFPKVGAQLVAMDHLSPSEIVLDCGGRVCFDFTPLLIDGANINYPFLRLQGFTITGGRAGVRGGPAIFSPDVKSQEWEFNGVLNNIFMIHSCIFYNHSSLGEGGALYITSESNIQTWEIYDTAFIDNKASGNGGAISLDSSVLKLSNVTFENNTAAASGGAVRATSEFVGSALRVSLLKTFNNIAVIGGGVFAVLGANVDIKNQSRATGDSALGSDGGGFLVAEASTIKVSDTILSGLRAPSGNGGAFNVMGSIVDLQRVDMTSTSSKTGGGAITAQLCSLKIKDSTFKHTHATGSAKDKTSGGALSLLIRTRCTVDDSTFTMNYAAFAGGAIVCDGCTSLEITNGNFMGNKAGRGGALAALGVQGGQPVAVKSASFNNNVASVAGGGAIYWERWPPVRLDEVYATLEHVNRLAKEHSNIIQTNNSARYGNFIASGPSAIYYDGSRKSGAMNTHPFGPRITLRDNYTNQVIDRDEGVSIKVTASPNTAPVLLSSNGENIALVSTEGNALFPEFGIAGEPSSMRMPGDPHTVTVTASESSVEQATFQITVVDCILGEYLSKLGDVYACTTCPIGRYETKTNQAECTKCSAGMYEDNLGSLACKNCPVGLFQAKTGQSACGEPEIIPSYPTVANLLRERDVDNDYKLLLEWEWPDAAEELVGSKPMVEVSTKADFDINFRGANANLTITIDHEKKTSAIVHLSKPMYDVVIYARVRVNSGTAVGAWQSLLEPWEVTSDCDKDNFLNDLGDKYPNPNLWHCENCPDGSTCLGDIRWGQVYAKFGYWRVTALTIDKDGVEHDDPTVPDFFQQCLFEAACLGAPSTHFAGKFYNLSEGEELSDKSEDIALTDNIEICNWDWGHAHVCNEYGINDTVRCRLCQACRPGFKRQGRARCKICPESTANRVLLGFGVVGVIVGFATVVFMSINSAGTEAETSEAVKKVLINFLQICSLAALFPLKWPPAIEAIFAMMSAVSSPAQHILSPDCELSVLSAAEAFYYKQIGYGIMPLFVVVVCCTLWMIAYCCHKHKHDRSFAYYSDRVIITVVCILFLLYPTMVKQSLAALACEPVGTIYYLAVDLQEVCYETRHFWFVLAVSVPQIALYTVGLPMAATLILMKNRANLGNRRVQFRYGILFNGYRPRLYWWELTIAIRKVALVLIAGIYGTRLGPDFQVTVALLLIMLFTASHLVFAPFAEEPQQALPEIPFHIKERNRLAKLEEEKKRKQQKNKMGGKNKSKGKKNKMGTRNTASADANNETKSDDDEQNDRPQHMLSAHIKKSYLSLLHGSKKLKRLYYGILTTTNMHMIEFGSLSVCGLTLWSGLVFFLNDQKPRMSRFWTEVFSIVLAAVNVMCIVTMIVKYILAVVKEAHTRTAISVWAGKFFNFFFGFVLVVVAGAFAGAGALLPLLCTRANQPT